MTVIENLIRSCWEYYAFDDAITLAELYFAEKRSDRAAFLLATSYYRNGQYSSTYEFLKNFGTRVSETKFLFARCCEHLDKLTEAEEVLSDIEGYHLIAGPISSKRTADAFESQFGVAAPFAHALLARIYSKSNRTPQAVTEHRAALTKLPALFECYKSLCSLGAEDEPSQYFGAATVYASTLPATKVIEEWIVPNKKGVIFSRKTPCTTNATPEILVNSIETPPIFAAPGAAEQTTNSVSSSSDCKTPYFNPNVSSVPEPKLVPKAPTKNHKTRDVSHNTNRIVTRQQSQRVLTQNQSKIATRRSTRLFQSSVKENENEVGGSIRGSNEKITNNNNNATSAATAAANRISGVRKTTRTRKANLEKLAANNELNKAKSAAASVHGQTSASSSSANNNNNERASSNAAGQFSSTDETKMDGGCNENDDGVTTFSTEDCLFFESLRKFADIESALSRYDSGRVIELVENLFECHRSSPMGLLALARAYFEQANYHKADEYFSEMRRRYGYFVKGMEYYSTALWHLQRDTDLSALAQELTEKHKFAPESWCSAGNCFSLQKDNDTAIRFFQRAIQLKQDFAYAYTLLGHEYVAVEAYEQALQCFRAALRLQPRHYNAWYGLGLIYYKQEKLGLAGLHLRRALEINPRNSVLMCHVSLVQQGLQDRHGAMKLLDGALELSPRNALCRYHRAHLLFAQDRHQEALEELKTLKQVAPKEPMVYFLAGKVYKKMGEPHLALMNFSWATELDPRGEQHHPVVGDRRYDEEPVTALATMEPDEMTDMQAMESDDST